MDRPPGVGLRSRRDTGDERENVLLLVRRGSRGQAGKHTVGEQRDARGIVLPNCQVRQSRRQCRGVTQTCSGQNSRAGHRWPADVEQEVQVQVGIAVELLDIKPVLPGVEFPVDVSRVVPGHILMVRCELDREPDEWAAVQTLQEPFHDRPGAQFDVVEPREELRVSQLVGVGHGLRLLPREREAEEVVRVFGLVLPEGRRLPHGLALPLEADGVAIHPANAEPPFGLFRRRVALDQQEQLWVGADHEGEEGTVERLGLLRVVAVQRLG